MSVILRDDDMQIHEQNPFLTEKDIYRCRCGKSYGKNNIGQICSVCNYPVEKIDARLRNYKGFINDCRLRGPRELNKREQAFKVKIEQYINNNNLVVKDLNASTFISEHLDQFLTEVIGNNQFINKRVNWPKLYDLEFSGATFNVYQIVDYVVRGIFYPPEGEKARDKLYESSIDNLVEQLTNIISTVLFQHVMSD